MVAIHACGCDPCRYRRDPFCLCRNLPENASGFSSDEVFSWVIRSQQSRRPQRGLGTG